MAGIVTSSCISQWVSHASYFPKPVTMCDITLGSQNKNESLVKFPHLLSVSFSKSHQRGLIKKQVSLRKSRSGTLCACRELCCTPCNAWGCAWSALRPAGSPLRERFSSLLFLRGRDCSLRSEKEICKESPSLSYRMFFHYYLRRGLCIKLSDTQIFHLLSQTFQFFLNQNSN